MNISDRGTVFSGYRVSGEIDVYADNVTVSNNRIIVPNGYMFGVALRNTDGAIVRNNTISGTNATAGRLMVAVKDIYGTNTNTRVVGNNIYWVSTGVQTYEGLIEDNYIHDLGFIDGDHLNGTTSNGGTSLLTIRHNTVFNSFAQTDAISLFEDFGVEANRVIDNNLVAGGGYTIYGGQNPGGPTSYNVRITNNRFSRIYFPNGGHFGPVTAFNPTAPGNAWSGNIWDDTGRTVDP